MSRPWMPLYIADFVADTLHLSAAQVGAYTLLIGHYWQHAGLPDDDAVLARIARLSAAEWRRSRPALAALFHDGWKHKRIDAELARAAEISSKRAASAKQKHSNSSANAEQVHTHARASPQPQPQPQPQSQEEPSSLRSEARKRASRLPSDWLPSEEDFEFAHGKGIAHAEIKIEAEKFRNYWIAKGGKDATKVDWPATWRNWILNAKERKPNGTGPRGGAGKGSPASDFFAGIAQVAANIGGDDPVAGRADEDIPRGRVEIDG